MLKTLANSLLSLVYPQVCHVCASSVEDVADGVACSDCWESTRFFDGSQTLCSKCGAFMTERRIDAEGHCYKCRNHFYDRAVGLGLYEKALSASILHLKKEPYLPARVKNLLTLAAADHRFSPATVVIPVPLSRKRLHERGFNQASVIGRFVANRRGLRFDEASLARTTHTPMHRAAMDRKAREMTVEMAFSVVRPKLIVQEHVLLVDDVLTSGATASNCARVLKKNGAGSVLVLTLARAE